ncbi:LOW QUALITY PROTEIN: nuclear pore complex protein Nup214 [Alosa sapidissima]|uniref:LOW QUALITY PROTEIN: nuclear pore complex protein Nup214 n=1 Tax=Alosa sapidissima TaxID=34773 RepID=UPI001C08E2BB|nr:LOW QUALITY PROTEIN: nuclear pore complex protein Nup214 [Alosa sapidissima]
MSDDPDSFPEREMKDFQFRQMKKIRVFDSPEELPKDRSNLLAVSNKFGLTFVGLDRTLKVFFTKDIIDAVKDVGNPNEIVEGVKALEVPVELPLHHLALSSDELTVSACGMSEEAGLSMAFYDVRSFLNKARQEKAPFASLRPGSDSGTLVQDLKWNPVQASMLAACLSDGSMMVLEVTSEVKVTAQLPPAVGITCVCWSPKGKQVAAGKQDATVIQYTPALQEKKVIPCPSFYSSDNPVKVLDVLWLSTFNFAVAYAAADGSPETPPELVVVSLPKKDEKRAERYLNFNDLVYGTCTERQHHYFLCHIEDWDLVLAASAASIEVSIIAKQEDKQQPATNWELWLLEDASRAELPVTQNSDDTLPLGVAIDFTSQDEIHISDDKKLPAAPTLMMLSTDGVLCPFSMINMNPGAKQLVAPATSLALDGERPPSAGISAAAPTPRAPPSTFPPLRAPVSSSTPPPPATATSSAPAPAPAPVSAPAPAPAPATGFSFGSAPPATSSSSIFSLGSAAPPAASTAAPPAFSSSAAPPAFSSSGGVFSFSAASKLLPVSGAPGPAASAFSFSAPSVAKPPLVDPGGPAALTPSVVVAAAASPALVPGPTPQRLATASPLTIAKEPATPAIRLNLNDRFSSLETPAPFSFSSPKPRSAPEASAPGAPPSVTSKPAAVRPVQTSTATPAPPKVVQTAPPQPQTSTPEQAAVSVKALEKQQLKDSDPVMAGILEEIAHFQKELDELKARSSRTDFRVGSIEEMRELRKESEDLHVFTLEIKETTESLHGDISTLKTTLLEGFAGAEDAKAHCELNNDPSYLQLLYKKPLDPRREDQLKEIRRLYQYVKFAVEDVNAVLDVEWEKHLENRKKQKHMVIPERHVLFNALANNLEIITQQKLKLDQLLRDLHSLRLYSKTAAWTTPSLPSTAPSGQSLDKELEGLRDALLKASLETSPKTTSKSPGKMTPAKQSQLRNFLSKRQTPHVRSTAPASLSRSAFLSPKYYEDLDDVSSTSSLSQALEVEEPGALHVEEEEEEEEEVVAPLPVAPPAMPRHPAVVRTPSIQPGFSLQSTPFSKTSPALGLGAAISPIPTNNINLGGAESTALATKTVKHGAPPTEKATPLPLPAQQAAANAALRRQMANQKPVGTSLTESTLKTVPQVVNVQELKDKGPTMPISTVISSSVPAPAVQVIQQVLATTTNQAKRGPVKVTSAPPEATTPAQTGFVFGAVTKADGPAATAASSASTAGGEQSSKTFSFSAGPAAGFSFSSAPQTVKDAGLPKFSFGSSSKLFGGAADETSSIFPPKSTSPALGGSTNAPTPPPVVSGEPVKLTSAAPALRGEPQAPKPAAVAPGGAGETLGSFYGLRVGQGDEEAKEALKGFSFGQPANGKGGGGFGQFSFGRPAETVGSGQTEASGAPSSAAAAAVSAPSSSVFKPPESTPGASKPAFSVTHPNTFSLLTAPLPLDGTGSVEGSVGSSEPSPPADASQAQSAPSIVPVSPSPPLSVEGRVTPAAVAADKPPTPPSPALVVSPTPPPSSVTPPAETAPTPAPTPDPAASAGAEPPAPASTLTPAPAPEAAPAAPAAPDSSTPAPLAPPTSDKPGSIFGQPPPYVAAVAAAAAAATPTPPPGNRKHHPRQHTLGLSSLTTVISTAAPATTPTPTPTTAAPAAVTSVFGQPPTPPLAPLPQASARPPPPTGFGAPAPAGPPTAPSSTPAAPAGASTPPTGFGAPVFGQVGAFGQPVASTAVAGAPGSASSFSFGQSSFGAAAPGFGQPAASTAPAPAASSSASGGGLFGASSAASSASSFSFGTSAAGSAASTGAGGGSLFGQSGTPAFGQQSSGFGQGSVFGSNTTTTSSTGFSFGQPSGFGSTPTSSVFGQQPSSGGIFGQAPSSGSLFGAGSAASAPPPSGFFSGLGGKPSEDAANKNPFGATTGGPGFGQPNQAGSSGLFGNSGAKNFSFGGSSFGEQKPSGTFSTGAGSVATQGFGSFGSSPTKPGGFGSAPVFGSPPAFGGAPAFGAGAAFGSSPSFNSPMAPSAGKVFGEGTAAANMGGFGFASPQNTPTFGSIANQSAPSFGNLAQQNPGFGSTGGFGSPSGFGGGGGGGFTGGFGSTNQSSQSTFGGWRR